MHQLQLEFMPETTQKNFARLNDDPRLAGFTLVGDTALACKLGKGSAKTWTTTFRTT